MLHSVLLLRPGDEKPHTTFIELRVNHPSVFQLQSALYTQGLAPNCLQPKKLFLFARSATKEQNTDDVMRETAILTLDTRMRKLAIDRYLY
jgi:hypothetical protein